MAANNIDTAIKDSAEAGIAKASGDQGSMESHDLKDLILSDQYLASKSAANSKGRGLLLTKLSPPGTA